MEHSHFVRRIAPRAAVLAAFIGCLWLAGCQTASPPTAPSAAASPAPAPSSSPRAADAAPAQAQAPSPAPVAIAPVAPPPETVAFDTAIERAASSLFSAAEKLPDVAPAPPRMVIIDPLIDGNTAQRTVASESMGKKISDVIAARFGKFKVGPFRKDSLAANPLLLVGTLTAINAAGDPAARNDIYRICLALVDVRSGKVVAKGLGRATEQSVDATPLPYFRDTPTWVKDKESDGYVRTCQGTRAGDAADALYLETLPTAMLVDEAIRAYNERKFADAQRLYRTAVAMPGGEQKRVIAGLYVSSWRLRRTRDAEDAFGKIVVRGLEDRKLGVKFLFKPNSADFVPEADLRAQYALWTRVIAQRAAETNACLAVVGHTSRSGRDDLNDALSLKRAQVVQHALERRSAALRKRLSAQGAGSRETIVGSGTDDLRDALDRRVEFRVSNC